MYISKKRLTKLLGLLLVFSITSTICNAAPPNKAPKSSFTYDINGNTVDFTNTTTDDNDDPATLTYLWEFGDDSTDTSQHTSHTYPTDPADITYSVILSATDSGGRTGTSTQDVTIPGGGSPATTATVVNVRKNCAGVSNCFNTVAEGTNWIWTTRTPEPSAGDTVLMQIGAGDFDRFVCNNAGGTGLRGFVTVRGSGIGTTRIISPDNNSLTSAVLSTRCTELTFESLSMVQAPNTAGYTIWWLEGGNSVWSDVFVENHGAITGFRSSTWYDSGCIDPTTTPKGTHYWFSSKLQIKVRNSIHNTGYSQQCASDSWFYGSEIEVITDASSAPASNVLGIELSSGQVQAFGTAIRVYVDPDSPSDQLYGRFNGVGPQIFGSSSATFHSHGGIVAVNAEPSAVAFNVQSINIPTVHAFETAYTLKPPAAGGVATRIAGDNKSPFIWEPQDNPPTIVSTTGSDMFVEIDCGTDGNCDGGGIEAHLMIYNSAQCGTGNPWFDSVTGRCRNAPAP